MKKNKLGKIREKTCFFLMLSFLMLLSACGDTKDDGTHLFQIYYIDKDGTGLVSEEYEIKEEQQNTVDTIQLLLAKLQTNGEKGRYQNPIQPDVEISDFMIKETQLSIYFTAAYNNKSGFEEILARAAIVKTMCQIPAVDLVEFYVEDQPLTLSGNAVGLMDNDTFMDELRPEFKEQNKQVTLYFSQKEGDRLMEVSLEVTYSAAEPLAQLLLEKLIDGPESIESLATLEQEDLIRTIPSGTKINSVTIRDNICYVDLSSEFMDLIPEVKSDVTVYSIVNTLCELSNVSKVQFTVDGQQWEKYGETENFNTPYERNLDLVSGGASIWVNP